MFNIITKYVLFYHIIILFVSLFEDIFNNGVSLKYIIKNRFFLKDKSTDILIHAASCGEAKSALPLIDKLIKKKIKYRLSVNTPSGFGIAKKSTDNVFLKPYDTLFSMLHMFLILKPKIIVISGSDTWPCFIFFALLFNVKIYYINYKIKKLGGIRNCIRNKLHYSLSTNIYLLEKQERQKSFGIIHEKYMFMGDLKFLYLKKANKKFTTLTLAIVSAHQDEFTVHLQYIKYLIDRYPFIKIIYIPRHLNWLGIFKQQTKNVDYIFIKDVNNTDNVLTNCNLQVCWKFGLVDTVLSKSHICLMGNTFNGGGGHNLIEPAINKNAIITGPYTRTCQNQVNILNIIKTNTISELISSTCKIITGKKYLIYGNKNYDCVLKYKKHIEKNLDNFIIKLTKLTKLTKY